MKRFDFAFLVFLSSAAFLGGCEKEQSAEATAPEKAVESLKNPFHGSDIAAKVNGEPVFAEEVEFTIARMFSEVEQTFANEDVRKNILESLIAARAMRQKQELALSENERQEIEAKVWAYREELYVKAYLQQYAVAEPVTQEMVENYYRAHPEKFGAEKRKRFEMLRTEAVPAEQQRDKLLAKVPQIRESQQWAALSKELGLLHQVGESGEGLLNERLRELIGKLKVGETSDLVVIDGVPHLLRITEIREVPPKPLHEVSARIRTSLSSLQLRSAVKKVSDEVIESSKIDFMQAK